MGVLDGNAARFELEAQRINRRDPDLQGTFTNTNEVGTPFERPAEIQGRRLEGESGSSSWTLSMVLTPHSGEQVLEYACHEGNRAMGHTLSAARAEEQATQKAGK